MYYEFLCIYTFSYTNLGINVWLLLLFSLPLSLMMMVIHLEQ